MNFVVDYGNTAAKVGIFDQAHLIDKHIFTSADESQKFLQQSDIENLIVSSVNTDANLVVSWANPKKNKFILHHTLPLPVRNLYKTPSTLGPDRLAAVCGAHQLFPGVHCLVIDAGTCITYDLIDDKANYRGGAISPGLNMRFKAVHTFTAKLPLVSPKEHVELIGNSTESCIESGVVNGLLAEVTGIVDQYREKFAGLKVILCGGDARFFENQLKASIFASPELVLIGLNSILSYNVNL